MNNPLLTPSTKPILETRGLSKSFQEGNEVLTVLNHVSLTVSPGEIVALLGPSGAGKSTLLHILGLLEKPDGGEILLNEENVAELSDRKRTQIRCHTIGFVYQFHHLLPEFTALENIVLPQLIAGIGQKQAKERAEELLQTVGLKDRSTHLPSELSGGEQQRVAIARAIANQPALLLADEPTGNLDTATSLTIFEMIKTLAHQESLAVLMVTHNPDLAALTDRTLTLKDGEL